MPPKGASTRLNPIRLQTVERLRIRRPNKTDKNPCETAMSAMLNCWASAGHTAEGCAALEEQLRQCMDTPVRLFLFLDGVIFGYLWEFYVVLTIFFLAMQRPKTKKTSNINYHLARMYPKLVGPTKTNK
ncbi:hypothetical protein PHISCL_08801 [Aspergillus sclerotialis]|uniref:37S ribosomal protein mrp10, mitochondrial n=1 Tax=Aspergillus sclerotialis TaxID=2070753 RepID=A0A3A2Z7K4_9EURO|nr:hypothetical protein PHISCL_08801 [Aspergillus sclerotialis]